MPDTHLSGVLGRATTWGNLKDVTVTPEKKTSRKERREDKDHGLNILKERVGIPRGATWEDSRKEGVWQEWKQEPRGKTASGKI